MFVLCLVNSPVFLFFPACCCSTSSFRGFFNSSCSCCGFGSSYFYRHWEKTGELQRFGSECVSGIKMGSCMFARARLAWVQGSEYPRRRYSVSVLRSALMRVWRVLHVAKALLMVPMIVPMKMCFGKDAVGWGYLTMCLSVWMVAIVFLLLYPVVRCG